METIEHKRHPFEAVNEAIARTMDRESLIDWLVWNDPNGVYRDIESLNEFGNVLTRENALEIVLNQLNDA